MANEIVFLLSFLTCSLLVYKKNLFLYVHFFLNLAALPKVFNKFKSFLVKSLGSFKYRIISAGL
jgi:hypothetical protein